MVHNYIAMIMFYHEGLLGQLKHCNNAVYSNKYLTVTKKIVCTFTSKLIPNILGFRVVPATR